jgi:hypothetical protein
MARIRRRWLTWLGASILVLSTVVGVVLAICHDRYGFLERFHPRHVVFDPLSLYPPNYRRPAGMAPFPEMSLLIFSPEDAGQVLAAMKAELTPNRGYYVADRFESIRNGTVKGTIPPMHDQLWSFASGFTPGKSISNEFHDFLQFGSGEIAANTAPFYERSTRPPAADACIVIVRHNPTWIEKQVMAVGSFVHL